MMERKSDKLSEVYRNEGNLKFSENYIQESLLYYNKVTFLKFIFSSSKTSKIHNFLNSLFKLSYPANPRVPFLVECLEVKKTKEFG